MRTLKEFPVNAVGPLRPYTCSYTGTDGHEYSLTIYATSEEEVYREVQNMEAELKDFKVDGVLHSILKEVEE